MMVTDGCLGWQVQGAPTSSEEAAGVVWQQERGGPDGGIPIFSQNRTQAPQVFARYVLCTSQ